jgi:hypothetical protein
MKWAIGTAGLTQLLMQQQRPTRNTGPRTRPRRPRLAVVRWLLLDSWTLWRYTWLASSYCFASTLFLLLLLALRLMLRSEEKTPTGLVIRWGFCFIAAIDFFSVLRPI